MKARLYKIFSVLAVFFFCLTTFTAGAADFTTGTRLYLKPNSNWTSDGARFAAYFFYKDSKGNESNKTWASMTGPCDGIYEVVAPQYDKKDVSFNYVIFCRMNPGSDTNDWDTKWDQTGNLSYNGTKNLYTIPGSSWDGSTNGTNYSNWSAYSSEYKILGVGNDWNWADGLTLVANPNNANEVMYNCLNVTNKESIKIVKNKSCYFGKDNVKDGSVSVTYADDGNVILPKGFYDFYFDKTSDKFYIGYSTPTSCYIVGLEGGDKEMTRNGNQYELKDIQVKSTDVVKIKLQYACGNVEYKTLDPASCATSSASGITMKDGYYDFYFKLDNNQLYVGANPTNAANADKYYLMGVDGDWDKADESNQLTQNPNDADELVLLGQKISQSDSKADAIKIVKKSICAVDEYYAQVKPSSTVIYTGGGTGLNPPNIVIEDGTYDFYFNKTNGKIYITGSIKNARVVYLDPKVENGSDWESDGARMAIYYFKSSNTNDNGWIGASYCDGYYYAYLPEGYDKYDWCRMNPDGENNWENRWNQTNSITYSEAEPLTKLKEMEKNSDQIPYNGSCGISYDNLDCNFPPLNPGDTLYVHINQFEDSDPCNYKFSSFEQAFAVLKNNDQVCTSSTCLYGSLKEDEITLTVPVVMLVHYGPEPYIGTEKVGMSGGHIYDAPAIFFRNINKDGNGHTLVVRTADPYGNRAVIVHPVIRRSTNIVLDNLDIVSDPSLRDNAIDIDTGIGMGNLEGLGEDYNIVPLSNTPHNITLKNSVFESYGRNCIHVVGIKGIHVENNEFYTKYDFSVNQAEGEDVVDWGGTIKFINTTDVKFLRNDSEGTLATSFFIQGCQRVLLMNNVFWNDNAVAVPNVASKGRTVANVRLVNYGAQADKFPIKNIGIYYNTFFIKNNDLGAGSYHKFDFFRLGGKEQPVTAANFEPNTIRFQYNNCYSYDEDITGNNDDENATTFYLQSIGKSEDWCQCFKYNNFWSEYDKVQEGIDKNHVSSNFEMGKFCVGEKETYNAYVNAKEQVCQTDPARPSALVVKGGSLNIGTVIVDDVSLQGADKIFTDRINGNTETPIRPTIVVDNSNESLSPSDHIYKEPGTIHFYTSPIVGSQTTDVHVSSVALTKNSKVYLSIVDGDVSYFAITDEAGQPLPTDATGPYLTTDGAGSLDNQPIYITFKRPTGQANDATFSAFLQILPASDNTLKMLIPLKGHNTIKVKEIKGAWTVGAFQQREVQPVDTIIWSGKSSTNWDDRNNWYKTDGTSLTCLDALTEDLTVIIPSKDSKNYITPARGITQYPTLPDVSTVTEFGETRTERWHGEQVNAGSNTSASTTKVASRIYMEYGASLVGVEELNSGGIERYTEVEQEFIARRKEWLLVGTVVRPWNKDEEGNIVEVDGFKTRTALSGDYYKWHFPQVYMREATIKDGEASWNATFPELGVPLPQDRAFAIYVPNEYGPDRSTAKKYNKKYGTNYDPDELMRYTFTGRFYNEVELPVYKDLKAGVPVMLTNTYPANIDAVKMRDAKRGTVQVYSYKDKAFNTIEQGTEEAVIQAQHSFVFTPAEGIDQLSINEAWLLNTEVTHRSAEVEKPYMRIEMRNVAKQTASNVCITVDENKADIANFSVDAPKIFNTMNNALPDLYVMRYDTVWAGVHIPQVNQPIPLGVRVNQKNQTFTISLLKSNMLYDVILDDRMEGKTYNLSQGETCQVADLGVGTCKGRFFITLSEVEDEYLPDNNVTTNIANTQDNLANIGIHTQGNNIVVSCTQDIELQTIMVTDMAGRYQVYQVSGRYVVLSLPLVPGIYTVHAIGDNAMRTQKVQVM